MPFIVCQENCIPYFLYFHFQTVVQDTFQLTRPHANSERPKLENYCAFTLEEAVYDLVLMR